MLVDVHCHLDFSQFDKDRGQVVGRAEDILIVNSTVDPELVGKSIALSEEYDNVYCTLGFGASDLDTLRFDRMRQAIEDNRKKIVGIGEVGLDYYWVKDEAGRAFEREHFESMLNLAKELNLPVVVHCREAETDCINILRQRKIGAIMHCFSGKVEEAFEAVESGCLISVPANVVSSKSRQRLVEALPLESLVLETDAPYLAPVRGERSEPAHVRLAAKKIAQLKGVGIQQVGESTTANALRFFRINNG